MKYLYKHMHFCLLLKTWTFNNIGKDISKNLSSKHIQKLFYKAKQSVAIQKTTDSICNLAGKITNFSRN